MNSSITTILSVMVIVIVIQLRIRIVIVTRIITRTLGRGVF